MRSQVVRKSGNNIAIIMMIIITIVVIMIIIIITLIITMVIVTVIIIMTIETINDKKDIINNGKTYFNESMIQVLHNKILNC